LTYDISWRVVNLQLQNKNDPNISFCPADHSFISVGALEAEGKQLLEAVVALMYTSK
jgi:symplekin